MISNSEVENKKDGNSTTYARPQTYARSLALFPSNATNDGS